jgi:hypothetical protein
MTERCWHGKFSEMRCAEPGRFGRPDDRADASSATRGPAVPFMRAARWCLVHRHPGDLLVETDPPGQGHTGAPPEGQSS